MKIRENIGLIFRILGIIGMIIFGIWSFIIAAGIVIEAVGLWGVVVGIFFAPIILVAAPWYALVVYGTWFPLIITYGGGIISFVLFIIGGGAED